jgi:hypothetical protein
MTLRAGIAAVAAGVLTYLATWALLFVVCLFDAGGDSGSLPSPNSWTLRAVYLAVAILVGFLRFRACWRWERAVHPEGDRRPGSPVLAVFAVVAVLVVSGSMQAYGVSREHNYLKYLPPGVSREAGLAYGHQACDWLTARPWGRPPGPDGINVPPGWGRIGDVRGRRRREVQSKTLVYEPYRTSGKWHWSNSTVRLKVYYLEHLDAQHPGPLTHNEREQASVIGSAWFELCPFQQWVHRPVVGSSGD